MKAIYLAALGLAFALVAGHADEGVTIVGMAGEEAPDHIYLVSGKQLLPFPLQPFTPGPAIQIPDGRRNLRFVEVLDPPVREVPAESVAASEEAPVEDAPLGEAGIDGSGELKLADHQIREVAEVRLGQGSSFALLFGALYQTENGPRYNVEVIDNDSSGFPVGAVRLMNRSPFQVAFQLGNERRTLAPEETTIVKPQLDRKNRSYIQLAARHAANGEWALFHEGVVSVAPRQRSTLLFAYTSTYLDLIESDGPRGTDGKLKPEMVVIPWHDRPPLPRTTTSASQ